MTQRKKDEAIANPGTNSGPRYPYGVVLWQGRNHRIVLDETPPNAKDTSGGSQSYSSDPGGGVFQISGRDGSVIELGSDSGRITTRATGQMHTVAGKGMSTTNEGHGDTRHEGGTRNQTKDGQVDTAGGDKASAGGGQTISTNKKTRTAGTEADTHSITEKDNVSMTSGNDFGGARGGGAGMTKGDRMDVINGEYGTHVIAGNASAVFQKSYKTHTDDHHYSRVGQKFKQHVLGSYDMKTEDVIVIESPTKIVFKVGDSTIVMTPGGIDIKSSVTKVDSEGDLHLHAGGSVKQGPNKCEATGTLLGTWVGSGSPPEAAEGAEGADVSAADSSG
jgi:hypothetical protein